jgi:glycosyltransferase involved in cell wall biosynthesis
MKTSNIGMKMPLRVLFFDHVAAMSGGEIALMNLIQRLDRSMIEPIVLLGEEGELCEHLRTSTEVHVLPISSDIRQARKDTLGLLSVTHLVSAIGIAKYVIRLAQFIRRHRIDLVHTNSLKSDLLGGFAARLAGTPVIWHVRDRISSDYLPAKVAFVFRALSRWIPTLIIANSHSTSSTLSKSTSARIYVVHDGVPLENFESSAPRAYADDVTTVGIVGRISPWKGQEVFLRAAAEVRQLHPQTRFRILGAALFGEAEYEEGLHRLVDELQLGEAVSFDGFQRDIPAAMAELDIVVHASTKPEPFGQVIIEAMASAKPVIATRAGGVLEIVEDGVTGKLVPMGDAGALARAITELLNDPDEARALGWRGRVCAERQFSMDLTVERVVQVYRELLDTPISSPAVPQREAVS